MSDEARLSDLLSHWQAQYTRGRDVPAAELCRECPALTPELERRILALKAKSSAAARAKWPSLPGYQILDKLAEGGMGVVYRARQNATGRDVALKMARAGENADPAYLARFQGEAAALTRLQHPHIVGIVAGGTHEGQPFFALEFIEGGSLEKAVRGRPQPPHEAAHLVMLLARAVQHAHAHGIIHRDLKPGNVLLAEPAPNPELNTAYGCPKVTDFGLAKYLESGQTMTVTGAVMGTPAYMAPEQALGISDLIGPGVDVYSLGAILYELLTGKVPIKGRNPVETLVLLRSKVPEPPRELRRNVPEVLERICLKCLEKNPIARYRSAGELADALERFLRGEAPASERGSGLAWLPVLLVGLGAAAVVGLGVTVWLLTR